MIAVPSVRVTTSDFPKPCTSCTLWLATGAPSYCGPKKTRSLAWVVVQNDLTPARMAADEGI
jgi:hypothetical protein